MNVSSEEQEIIQEAFQYYDQKGDSKIAAGQVSTCLRSLGCVPSEKQLTSFTKQWESKDTRVSIEEFIPIYGDLKKTSQPADEHALLSSCLSNFDRDQEGYIQQADLRHMLENFGEKMSSAETEEFLHQIEFVNGKARIVDVVDLVLSRS